MSGLALLLKLAEHRADEAAAAWRQLAARYADAKHKLQQLERHRDAYRELTDSGLRDGMPAGAIAARIGFVGQIEAVLVQQVGELERLEAACARQWQALHEARGERRRYEILAGRVAARAAAASSRRQRLETEEALLRGAPGPAAIFDAHPSDE